jgi:hypothetical protein
MAVILSSIPTGILDGIFQAGVTEQHPRDPERRKQRAHERPGVFS